MESLNKKGLQEEELLGRLREQNTSKLSICLQVPLETSTAVASPVDVPTVSPIKTNPADTSNNFSNKDNRFAEDSWDTTWWQKRDSAERVMHQKDSFIVLIYYY